MTHIATLAKDRILGGGKVIILTDFVEMQKAVEAKLKDYGVSASIQLGIRPEGAKHWRGSTMTMTSRSWWRAPGLYRKSLDLSVANTCICCDILWAPGDQAQAWSRILTPTDRERKCEIFIVLSRAPSMSTCTPYSIPSS